MLHWTMPIKVGGEATGQQGLRGRGRGRNMRGMQEEEGRRQDREGRRQEEEGQTGGRRQDREMGEVVGREEKGR
jgi:hypothetical protein